MARNNNKSLVIRYVRAIEAFEGGRDELATKLGISRATIDAWIMKDELPARYAVALSKLFEERVNVMELLGEV